jgi:hypothetical protein
LRTGDIAVPSYTSREQYIVNAAEEIDAAVGHLYVTPFDVDETVPANRPSILFLKKLNWLLASGRFVLDVAAAGEMDNLHAYGKRMLDEAAAMLKYLTSEELVLVGATKIKSDDEQEGFTGPMISNEDSESLVEAFYRRQRPSLFGLGEPLPVLGRRPPVMPYGE